MKLSELIKQPVSLISDDDISRYIVRPNEPAERVLDLLKPESIQDVLVVYVGDDGKIQGVINRENVFSFLEALANRMPLSGSYIKDLSWNQQPAIMIGRNKSIYDAILLLENSRSNVFLVTDGQMKYLGQIFRKSLLEKINTLVK